MTAGTSANRRVLYEPHPPHLSPTRLYCTVHVDLWDQGGGGDLVTTPAHYNNRSAAGADGICEYCSSLQPAGSMFTGLY